MLTSIFRNGSGIFRNGGVTQNGGGGGLNPSTNYDNKHICIGPPVFKSIMFRAGLVVSPKFFASLSTCKKMT